jgi:hypothetical protein
MTGTRTTQPTTYLSRTCLKWTAQGELERDELQQVLARLAAVDGYGAELWPAGGDGSTPST